MIFPILDRSIDGSSIGLPHFQTLSCLITIDISQKAQDGTSYSGWWFGTFVIFPNSWDDDPIRLSDFSEGRAQPPTSHGFTYPTIVWLVVSNMFLFHNIWDNPSH